MHHAGLLILCEVRIVQVMWGYQDRVSADSVLHPCRVLASAYIPFLEILLFLSRL